jgi:signal transduction histidine kinase
MIGGWRSSLRRYGIYFLAWTAASIFYFSQDQARRSLRNDPTPWQDTFFSWSIGVYTCAAFTPLILFLGRRWSLGESSWWKVVPLHFAAGSALSMTVIAVETPLCLYAGTLAPPLKGASFSAVFPVLLVFGFHGYLLMYWIVIGVQAAARYYRQSQERKQVALRLDLRTSELAAQLSEARLNALRAQLQPHFLFNTLGAIVVLVRQQNTRQAEEMLVRLSDLLRAVLANGEGHEVPLRQEIEYLKLYLAIEEVRFQDRLSVAIHSDEQALEAAVPYLGLQPIVENAIRHGLGKSLESVRVELNASVQDENLTLVVRDSGPGIPEGDLPSTGIGLANTRARLAHLYGGAAGLKIERAAPTGVVVTITLPYRPVAENQPCA